MTVPANPYLGKVTAPTNLKLAAQQEAEVEVQNVAMYDRLLALATGDAMLTQVFTNLRAASQEMHLPMFSKAAAGNGTLTAADLTAFHNQNMNHVGQANRQGVGRGGGHAWNGPAQGWGHMGNGYGPGWRR